MKKYIPVLQRNQLFSGMSEEELLSMLECLHAKLRTYKKGEFVINQGECPASVMILAEGKLHIQRDDHWGNRSIISVIEPAEMFGEAYAAAEGSLFLNDVLALEDSTVVFLDVKKMLHVCSSECRFHSQLVQNLFFAISEKNRRLVQKLGIISRRTTREKLLAYLSDQAASHKSSEFSIPFNRQQLADFLSVDRSAMSAELCRMRDEGLLDFERSRFILH